MTSWIHRWRLPLLLVAAYTCFLFAPLTAEEATTTIDRAHGTISKVGNFGYGIVPEDDPGSRYAPTEPLAEEFRHDGLRVVFSGEVLSADESGGRRWGTPLRVTHIEKLDESASNDGH